MSRLIIFLGLLASLGLVAISVAINFQVGAAFGETQNSGFIYGGASGLVDVLKSALPFTIMSAVASRRFSIAMLAGGLFALFVLFSFSNAIGFGASNRTAVLATRSQQAKIHVRYQSAFDDLMDRRRSLPDHRSVRVIEANMENLRWNTLWSRTKACKDATRPASV